MPVRVRPSAPFLDATSFYNVHISLYNNEFTASRCLFSSYAIYRHPEELLVHLVVHFKYTNNHCLPIPRLRILKPRIKAIKSRMLMACICSFTPMDQNIGDKTTDMAISRRLYPTAFIHASRLLTLEKSAMKRFAK